MTTKGKTATNPLVRFDEQERLVTLIKERKAWHTKKSTGGISGRNTDVIGTYMAQATHTTCSECHQYQEELSNDGETYGYPCYMIYSYKTVMYSKCSLCGHEYIDAAFYSKYTRDFQETLASVYPSYRDALSAQLEIERLARALWARDRAAGRVSTNRVLGYQYNGAPRYAKGGNLHEMLEYQAGHKLPGHHIHTAED